MAPNDYVITLSVPDYQNVSADPDITATTFAKHLEGYVHEQGWQTYGDVVVRFEQSPNLHTGQFRARGAINPDSATGEPNWLTETLTTIGSSYISLLKAAVVPLIFTAVVSSIANLRAVSNAAKLAWNTLLWFAITALIAVAAARSDDQPGRAGRHVRAREACAQRGRHGQDA